MLNDHDGILHHMEGHNVPTIARLFQEEGVKVSRVEISNFLTKYEDTGLIGRRIGYGKISKLTAETNKLVEDQMHSDVETTFYQLHKLLTSKDNSIFLRAVLLVN